MKINCLPPGLLLRRQTIYYIVKLSSPNFPVTKSSLGGIPITVYGYDSTYMVQFSYQGVNYDIETRDIDLEGLSGLLTGIPRN